MFCVKKHSQNESSALLVGVVMKDHLGGGWRVEKKSWGSGAFVYLTDTARTLLRNDIHDAFFFCFFATCYRPSQRLPG